MARHASPALSGVTCTDSALAQIARKIEQARAHTLKEIEHILELNYQIDQELNWIYSSYSQVQESILERQVAQHELARSRLAHLTPAKVHEMSDILNSYVFVPLKPSTNTSSPQSLKELTAASTETVIPSSVV